nr:unnamed protein product [Callosobruchus analis]
MKGKFGDSGSDTSSGKGSKGRFNLLGGQGLAKSATSGELSQKKPVRNFVIPKKDKNPPLFGQEFVPKFQTVEQQPLLIIKRTPSKINLPKETKPKVALNTKMLDTKKYFGLQDSAKKPPKRAGIGPKAGETVTKEAAKSPVKGPRGQCLVKQQSLPETAGERLGVRKTSFNFEVEDEDLNDIDGYIEELLKNEKELEKPVDPDKFKHVSDEDQPKTKDEKVDSSIEDLLKALEVETGVKDTEAEIEQPREFISQFSGEAGTNKPEDKIEDLLSWIEDLDHDVRDTDRAKSFSDFKYKNLERVLKANDEDLKGRVVGKLPTRNLSFFEQHLSGRPLVERRRDTSDDSDSSDDKNVAGRARKLRRSLGGGLKRSKTESQLKRNEPRNSVDLDMGSKVDIKKMLKVFESNDGPQQGAAPKRNFSIKRTSLQGNESTGDKDTLKPNFALKRNSYGGRSGTPSGGEESSPKKSVAESSKQDIVRRSLTKSKPVQGVIKKFEQCERTSKPPSKALTRSKTEVGFGTSTHSSTLEETLRDLERFVQQTIESIGSKYDDVGNNKVENESIKVAESNATESNAANLEVSRGENENRLESKPDAAPANTGVVNSEGTEFKQNAPEVSSPNLHENISETIPEVQQNAEKVEDIPDDSWCAKVYSSTQFFLTPTEGDGNSSGKSGEGHLQKI